MLIGVGFTDTLESVTIQYVSEYDRNVSEFNVKNLVALLHCISTFRDLLSGEATVYQVMPNTLNALYFYRILLSHEHVQHYYLGESFHGIVAK